jgi:KDO2-lipid IV(A) lauroyltransferase
MKNAPVLHRIEYALYDGVRRMISLLHHESARPIGALLGNVTWALAGSRRRTAVENLERVFPDLGSRRCRQLARQSFRHLGAMTCDAVSSFRFDEVDLCARLTVEGLEHLDAARAAGHGVLVMSAHLGTWEVAAYPVGLYREPMHVIGRPLDNPLLDRHLTSSRTRFGNATISKRGAARESIRVLRKGGVVGILIDQRVRPDEGIEVPFMGHDAITSPLLARLARKTGAPIVPLFGHLEPGGRYRVRFHQPLWPGDTPEADVLELTRQYLEVVEQQIRPHPQHWLWMHRRWRK